MKHAESSGFGAGALLRLPAARWARISSSLMRRTASRITNQPLPAQTASAAAIGGDSAGFCRAGRGAGGLVDPVQQSGAERAGA